MAPVRTGSDAVEWLLRRCGYDAPLANTAAAVSAECAAALNAAMQEIYSSPVGLGWAQGSFGFDTAPSQSNYTLAQNITTVVGEAYCDGHLVTGCQSFGSFVNAKQAYGLPSGIPRPALYHLRRHNAGALQSDASLVEMLLWPLPIAVHQITFTAQVEPPDLTKCSLRSVLIPVPDAKHETILLPLALEYLATSPKLTERVDREAVARKAQAARLLLGLTEPDNARRKEGARVPA
jgi:hypothetical protein